MRSANIQVLRALAALGVVGHHLFFYLQRVSAGRLHETPEVLAVGVDVFFVLSGYLMAETSLRRGEPRSFMQARIERVVPMYWLCTLATAVIAGMGFRIFGLEEVSPTHFLESMFFLPPSGANPAPLLYVGWTLNYEMFFYGMFALCLFLPSAPSRLKAVLSLIALLQLGGLLGLALGNRYLSYWGSPLLLEFAMGVLLSQYAQKHVLLPRAAWLVIAVALLPIASTEWLDVIMEWHVTRVLLWGLPSAAIVYAALSLERSGRRLELPWLLRLGDASFAIYLIHPFVLQVCGTASMRIGLHGSNLNCALSALAAAVFSVLAGLVVHQYMEKPLHDWTRGQKALQALPFARRPEGSLGRARDRAGERASEARLHASHPVRQLPHAQSAQAARTQR